tara:strand:- start:6466 stop:6582 length:117 start_codon:yes stop_codon:yes gene_type:complete
MSYRIKKINIVRLEQFLKKKYEVVFNNKLGNKNKIQKQ